MKKIRLPIIALNILFTLAVIVMTAFTFFQLENLKMPYGLPESAKVFSISQKPNAAMLPLDTNRINLIVDEIEEIANHSEITIINSNISNMGLGIYDSRRRFFTPDGTAFLFDVLKNEKILLRTGSYYEGEKSIQTISGLIAEVASNYDVDYLLFNNAHEYIFNFFDDRSLGGTFWIESENLSAVQDIIKIFEANNFELKYKNSNNSNFAEVAQYLFSNILYVVAMFGLICICINLGIFYFVYFNNFKKRMRLHLLYGAGFGKLVMSYLIDLMLNSAISSLIGVGLYVVIFGNTRLMIPSIYLFAAVAGEFAVNTLLFLICFFSKPSLKPKKLLRH